MKITNIYLSGLFWTLLPFCSSAQNNPFWDVPTGKQVDSLKKVLAGSKNDTVNMYLNRQIGMHNQELDRPVALASYKNMLRLAEKTDQRLWEAEALSRRESQHYVCTRLSQFASSISTPIPLLAHVMTITFSYMFSILLRVYPRLV